MVQSLISFLEHEAQPMIVLDPNYTILAANVAYQRQFGRIGQSVAGHKCYRISHHYDAPCDQAGEHCPMKKAREMRGPDRVLHIHHTPRGPEHVAVELRPIFDAGGAITAYVERLEVVRSASAKPSEEGLVGRSAPFNRVLAALQRSGTYRRVGSVETRHANFRLVAATHQSLEHMMARGEFRQDLYYRISAFPIALPPLRERLDDIALLVQSFLRRAGAGKRPLTIDADAMAQLQQRPWPGNIRELRNVLERASLFADDGVIRVEQLLAAPVEQGAAAGMPVSGASAPLAELHATFGGTRKELAAHLGLSERTLYRRLKALGIA
eukprot:gene4903-5694_t